MPSGDPDNKSKTVGKYLRHLNLGFQLFVAIGVFTFAGLWLDGKAGTTPLFTILGAAIGFAAGFRSLYIELFPSRGGRRGGPGGPEAGRHGSDSKRDRAKNDGRDRNSGETAGERDSGKGKRAEGKRRPFEGDGSD